MMPSLLPRHDGEVLVVGGPTLVMDLGGLRIVSDPTFDDPGPHGYLTKTSGPVVTEGQLADVDMVLVSHDNHADNLDDRGRAFAMAAPLLLTTTGGAERLGSPAQGLAAWETRRFPRPYDGELTVTAVPAVHGPEDGERDAEGNVNCQVVGFARRVPGIDAAVLHAGAARVPGKFRGRPVSLDSVRTAAAAAILSDPVTIPVHYDGWAHFTEGRDAIVSAFDDAGLAAVVRIADHGTWIPLTP
ncbi:MBL fold metallo-hydrolase [Mumia sp.]|uniref:MBL fold metallo-hydrolase n=1 Tax=Mumia sp. TaxID=1965300 RepID=UPI00262F2FB2|nr:MBL fold metallo-hydrolase [Mumia sp.]MDD9348483.1 MBL fold metallo-hydrolase [Mumia sp.]